MKFSPELTMALNIQSAFGQLNEQVKLDDIVDALTKSAKLGVTNAFTTFSTKTNHYLIRLNRKLWFPFTRENEQEALEILKRNGVETSVIFQGNGFQICRQYDKNTTFESIRKRGNPQEIHKAIELIAVEIAKYQNISETSKILFHPTSSALEDSIKKLTAKFGSDDKIPAQLRKFAEASKKIAYVLDRCDPSKTFSHNDLLLDSIYVDIENSKVVIVDWEYAVLSYWSNDLAKMSISLTPPEREKIQDSYHASKKRDASLKMPMRNVIQLQLNRFLLDFMMTSWGITPDNIEEYDEKLKQLDVDLAGFSYGLDMLYQKENSEMFGFAFSDPYESPDADKNNIVNKLKSKL